MFNPLRTPGELAAHIMCQPESPQGNDTTVSIKHLSSSFKMRVERSVFLLLAPLPFIYRRGPGILLLAFPLMLAW